MNKVKIFQDLHAGSVPFILPNAWNLGSARMIEKAGFKAIATTSAGIAFSQGHADGGFIDPELMFLEMAKIVAGVSLPVTVDIENGYGDVGATIKRVKAFGGVGANIEDADGRTQADLFEIPKACHQIRLAKEAAGPDFVLNARIDTYLTGQDDCLSQSIARGLAYVEAGADCIFIPGVVDKAEIKKLVESIPGPINILGGVSAQPLSLKDFHECGVTRITTGGSLMRATFATLQNSLHELSEDGDFSYATNAISDQDMNDIFS